MKILKNIKDKVKLINYLFIFNKLYYIILDNIFNK